MSKVPGTLTTTVKVQNGGSHGATLHPYLNRLITPREAARVQGFPDAYAFSRAKEESTSICVSSLCSSFSALTNPLLRAERRSTS